MLHDIVLGLALLFVFEGVLPFLSPSTFRNAMRRMASLPDNVLRIMGFVFMMVGLSLLYWVV